MASNPDSRHLPDGWITQFNSDYGSWFYVNKNAPGGPKSQWTHPADDVQDYQPPSGPPPVKTANSYGAGTPVQSNYNYNDDKARNEYNPSAITGQGQSGSYYQEQPQQSQSYQPQAQSYQGQQSYQTQQDAQRSSGGGGLLSKLMSKVNKPGGGQGFGGGGYGGQQSYGGYPQQQQGYGGYPQQGYGQQGGMMGGGMGGMMGGGRPGGMFGGGGRQGGGMGAGGAVSFPF